MNNENDCWSKFTRNEKLKSLKTCVNVFVSAFKVKSAPCRTHSFLGCRLNSGLQFERSLRLYQGQQPITEESLEGAANHVMRRTYTGVFS